MKQDLFEASQRQSANHKRSQQVAGSPKSTACNQGSWNLPRIPPSIQPPACSTPPQATPGGYPAYHSARDWPTTLFWIVLCFQVLWIGMSLVLRISGRLP